jgi:mRNA interferase RelE/StbE
LPGNLYVISFDQSFDKSLIKLKNEQVARRIIKLIDKLEQASSLRDVSSVKKLKGYENYYRIRIGDYRVIVEMIEPVHIRFILIGNRKEVYDEL